jgi:hypothetical protein
MAHSGVGYNFVDSPSGLIVPVGSDTTIGGEPVKEMAFDLDLPGGSTNFLREDGTWQVPAGGGGGDWDVTVVKGSDESVASSTVRQDDNELFFATGGAGEFYEFEFVIIYGSPAGGATPGLAFDVSEDATARGVCWVLRWGSGTITTIVGATVVNTSGTGLATATTDAVAVMRGAYRSGGGTLRFRWAQNSSGVNASIVRAGSLVRYRQIL